MSKKRSHILAAGRDQAGLADFQAFRTRVFASGGTAPTADWNRQLRGGTPAAGAGGTEAQAPCEASPSDYEAVRGEIARLLEEAEADRAGADRDREALVAQGRAALEEAQRQAAELVQSARRQVEEIEARAYQAGFEQGEEAGQQLGEQKMESVVRGLAGVVENAAREMDRIVKTGEEDLVKLSFLIALKVLHRELRQDPGAVREVVRAAMLRMRNAARIVVRVAPSDFKFIEPHAEEIRHGAGPATEVRIESDPGVPRGGCRLVSENGEVEAGILEAVRELQSQIWNPADSEDSPVAGD